jgi:hypothetical protein
MTMNTTSKRGPEAFRAKSIQAQGLGQVVISRFKAGGQVVEAGVFLVDAYGLGDPSSSGSALWSDCAAAAVRAITIS